MVKTVGAGQAKASGKGRAANANSNVPVQPMSGETSAELVIPPHIIGRVIGRGGSNIQQIRRATGVRGLDVCSKNTPNEQPVVSIVGSESAVQDAADKIRSIIEAAGPARSSPPASPPKGPSAVPPTVIAPKVVSEVVPKGATEVSTLAPPKPIKPEWTNTAAPPQSVKTEISATPDAVPRVVPSRGRAVEETPEVEVKDSCKISKEGVEDIEEGRLVRAKALIQGVLGKVHVPERIQNLPRPYKIAGCTAIGASTAGAVGGTCGAVVGGVSGLPMAPFTLGLSIPFTAAVVGGAGMVGGGVTGAATGAAVGTYMTRPPAIAVAEGASA